MFNLSNFRRKVYRRVGYVLVSMTLVLGMGVATVKPAQAGWLDLIMNGVQVYQLSNISDSQEGDLGKRINNQLINSGQIKLYKNNTVGSYVNTLGQKLAGASGRPNIPYTFQVVNDDAVNAFATMGGYVYVTTGLLKSADNEAELAGVVGHEIGHIAERHAVAHMRQAAITQGITGALGVNRDRLVNIGTQLVLELPNSRRDEYEADTDGFETMGRAGYEQSAMATFMQKLVRQNSPPEFLSTHPDASNRVVALQRLDQQEALPQATAGLSAPAYTASIRSLR